MAQRAHALTVQRFGRTMQFFVPLYISNYCYNQCTYCGFSVGNRYPRRVLSDSEIISEAQLLRDRGFDQIVVLTGEAEDKAGTEYIAHAIRLLSPLFASISIEVQPMSQSDYSRVIEAGADGLVLFQETYDSEAYASYHLAGKKRHFSKRLDAVEAGASAGFYKLTLGALLGLTDWRFDAMALSHHLVYMQRHFWTLQYGISFPRIKDMVGDFQVNYPISDRELVQFIVAFRLCFPDISITMSTRESAQLRDKLLPLGVTHISAESNTAPGGYGGTSTEPQFEISDHRSLPEMISVVKHHGYEPVMRDWVKLV